MFRALLAEVQHLAFMNEHRVIATAMISAALDGKGMKLPFFAEW